MLTKKHNPKISYISRILALPLFAFIILAFTIKTRPEEKRNIINLENEITVIIDAGHGDGLGARAEGYLEDDLVLQLAKTIKGLNTNDKIKILLTRENEQNVDIRQRVEFARKNNADLFISVHLNGSNLGDTSIQERTGGYEVLVSNKSPFYQKQSEILGAALVQELSKTYITLPTLVKRKVGVWVLDQNVCPSVLIECGYITDKNDRDFIIKKENQELIAKRILKAIEVYAASQNTTGKVSSKYNIQEQPLPDTSKPVKIRLNTETLEDTVDQNFLVIIDGDEKGRAKDIKIDDFVSAEQIERLDVFKGEAAVKIYGAKGKHGVILITTRNGNESSVTSNNNNNGDSIKIRATQINSYAPFTGANSSDEALLIIDGVEKGKVKDLSKFVKGGEQIKSINVYKAAEAIKIYGEKGAYGVIEVSTKEMIGEPEQNIKRDTTKPTTIFQKVEQEAEFPGGVTAWRRNLERNFNAFIPSDKGAPVGSYTLVMQFIVHLDGSLSDIKALTTHGYGMEEECIRFLSHGPKWIPAQQNGHKVVSYRKQPITFVIADR